MWFIPSWIQSLSLDCFVIFTVCVRCVFRISKRAKYSRRRPFDEDADIDYINERNMKFNKKLERFYGKYTAEIKQNLERGTAIWGHFGCWFQDAQSCRNIMFCMYSVHTLFSMDCVSVCRLLVSFGCSVVPLNADIVVKFFISHNIIVV